MLIQKFQRLKNTFEKNYIATLTKSNQIRILFFTTHIITMMPRIYYNGIIAAYTTLIFEVSWFGIGWGKTPTIIRLLSIILGLIVDLLIMLYIKSIKQVYSSNVLYYTFADLILDTYKILKLNILYFLGR